MTSGSSTPVSVGLDLSTILETKKHFPHLDALVSDRDVRRCLGSQATTAGWSLLAALSNPNIAVTLPLLRSLDENLNVLVGAIRSRKQLRDRLLNRDQLLNTLSELALARHQFEEGWKVELDYPFFDKRDVDLRCQRDGIERLVELVNMAIPDDQEIPQTGIPGMGFSGVSMPRADDPLVRKVIAKFNDKFLPAFERGWDGEAWIAVDYTKVHRQDIEKLILELTRPTWSSDLAALAGQCCHGLRGVCFYSYLPDACVPRAIRWEAVAEPDPVEPKSASEHKSPNRV